MLRLGSWGWPATRWRGNARRAWVQRGSAARRTVFLYGDTPSCYLEATEKQPRRGSGHLWFEREENEHKWIQRETSRMKTHWATGPSLMGSPVVTLHLTWSLLASSDTESPEVLHRKSSMRFRTATQGEGSLGGKVHDVLTTLADPCNVPDLSFPTCQIGTVPLSELVYISMKSKNEVLTLHTNESIMQLNFWFKGIENSLHWRPRLINPEPFKKQRKAKGHLHMPQGRGVGIQCKKYRCWDFCATFS